MSDNSNTEQQGDFVPRDETLNYVSDEESRKRILESYEKAGVDLPLVTLETVLDREISEDDARQTGAPRFRKLLNKASTAITSRKLEKVHSYTDDNEEDVASQISSYSSNAFNLPAPIPPMEDEEEPPSLSQATTPILDATPKPALEGTSIDNGCPTFDFCCPKNSNNVNNESVASDKYIMSNMQLPEGFEDECASRTSRSAQGKEEGVPAVALMDVEDSMMNASVTNSVISQHSKSAKNGRGVMSYLRGNRRFRLAMIICCLLHVLLISLIIVFATKTYEEPIQTVGSSSASSTDTSKTMFPQPVVSEDLDIPKALENVIPILDEVSNVTATEDVVEETISDVQVGESDVESTSPQPDDDEICVDTLEISSECMEPGAELLVYFDSCTPQEGDWVAIFDAAANPELLLDDEIIGWLYTCGDRICGEAIDQDVLSFARATGRAGVGTYRAHLLRNGNSDVYSALASSPPFRIVNDAANVC